MASPSGGEGAEHRVVRARPWPERRAVPEKVRGVPYGREPTSLTGPVAGCGPRYLPLSSPPPSWVERGVKVRSGTRLEASRRYPCGALVRRAGGRNWSAEERCTPRDILSEDTESWRRLGGAPEEERNIEWRGPDHNRSGMRPQEKGEGAPYGREPSNLTGPVAGCSLRCLPLSGPPFPSWVEWGE
ncbi:hypothetical protein NDU88_007244 [Pleurodeles waltl]|uniref:Uncharacterized protein n=1 Tax=Pleurodeles waltl TaxID=8319 RepID=A0AAV7NXE9_PLEWA|nr:hypothetical protein NDU88_007244 [Pleurodeles waltl]